MRTDARDDTPPHPAGGGAPTSHGAPPPARERSSRGRGRLGLVALTAAAIGGVTAVALLGGPSPALSLDVAGAPRLVDVTDDAGLAFTHGAFRWAPSADAAAMTGGGACWLDADGDGAMDAYLVSTWSLDEHPRWVAEEGALPRSTLWHNEDGRFSDVGDETGAALAIRGQGCLAADLDGDGHTDVYVTSDRTNVLLWNDGDGTFTVDDGAAGLDLSGWQSSASAGDVDGDGRLDVFVGGYVDPNARREGSSAGFPGSHRPVRDVLMRNVGPRDGAPAAFEVVVDSGLDPDGARYALGSVFTDVDRDGDLDLVVANDTDPNRLYRNDSTPGTVRFVDVAPVLGADDDGSGMGVEVADLDLDGRDDLVVTNLDAQGHALLVGAPGGFVDGRRALDANDFGDGLTGWGTVAVDVDGDGGLELLVGNGAIPVLSVADDARDLRAWSMTDGGLVDATARLGLEGLPARNARALTVADVDGDADPDVLVTAIAGPAALLATVGADDAAWLVVDPVGRVPGTVVEVALTDGRVLRRELRAGSGYLSTGDPRALFGVGDLETVVQVSVRWPDGTSRTLTGVDGPVVTVPRP